MLCFGVTYEGLKQKLWTDALEKAVVLELPMRV